MPELLFATRNEGKTQEIRHALAGVPFEILDINDRPELTGFEPHEHGTTYEENASIKAKEYGTKAGLLTLADDSGIEVEALSGAPGIESARYARGSDADRNMKLLEATRDVSDEKRGAQFVTAIAIYDPTNGTLRTAEERVAGRVTREPRGTRPFGYDPIFLYDEVGKTGGEMTLAEKDTYSHRGRALAKARKILVADFT